MNTIMSNNTTVGKQLVSFATKNGKYGCYIFAIWAIHDLCEKALDKGFGCDVTFAKDSIKFSITPSIVPE